jgi:NodT family efflux transporter outer membrane factor (OMF) lipoprotein
MMPARSKHGIGLKKMTAFLPGRNQFPSEKMPLYLLPQEIVNSGTGLPAGKQAAAASCFRAFCLVLLLQLVSCTPFSPPDRAGAGPDLPASYSLGEAVREPAQRWWQTFDSPRLDSLVNEALAENQDLRSSWARLDRARALARAARSELYPTLTGEADASYSELHTDRIIPGAAGEGDQYSLGLAAGYEIDLWGRIRAGAKSADLAAAASREDLSAAAMTVAAETAGLWVRVLGSEQRLQLLEQQLETNRNFLELLELRFRKSIATAVDVMQQKQLVERVRARIPLAEMEGKLLRDSLAVLLGRMPGSLPDIGGLPLPEVSGLPPAGVPAELLHNRPDIRAALLRLEAADQELVAARAARLPSLRLSGRATYDSTALEDLFDNWLVNLAAGLSAPLVDGGRRRAQADAAAAGVDDRLAFYRQAVLTAVREVEEALTREVKNREHILRTGEQLRSARDALWAARNRYRMGASDYLPVLTQLLSIQNLELDLVTRREELLLARIDLYRSLGGSWMEELPPPAGFATMREDEPGTPEQGAPQ